MTVEELMTKLQRELAAGNIEPESEVQLRNTIVSEEAMEAGSYGYADVSEVLIPRDGTIRLLPEEE